MLLHVKLNTSWCANWCEVLEWLPEGDAKHAPEALAGLSNPRSLLMLPPLTVPPPPFPKGGTGVLAMLHRPAVYKTTHANCRLHTVEYAPQAMDFMFMRSAACTGRFSNSHERLYAGEQCNRPPGEAAEVEQEVICPQLHLQKVLCASCQHIRAHKSCYTCQHDEAHQSCNTCQQGMHHGQGCNS